MPEEKDFSLTGENKPGFFSRYIVITGALLAMMAAALTIVSFGVFFNPVSSHFGWTHTETSGVYSSLIVISGLLGILAGRISDKFSPRVVITVCGILEGLAYLLLSRTASLWEFYFYYGILAGIGLSNMAPLNSLVARYYGKRRGVMTGFLMAGAGIGGSIAPPLDLYFISLYDWRSAYLIVGGIILTLVLISSLCLFCFKQTRLPSYDSSPAVAIKKTGIQDLNLRTAIPTFAFWILSLIIFCSGFTREVIMVHFLPASIDIGIPADSAATVLSVIHLANMAGSFTTGIVVDKIGGLLSTAIALALTLVGFLLFLGVQVLWAFYLFAIIYGIGFGILSISRSIIIAELFGLRSHGEIFGAVHFFHTIGGTLGPVVAGYIYDINQHYQLAFVLIAGLTLASLVMIIPLRLKARRL